MRRSPGVQVVSPRPGPPHRTLTLPGNIDAWYQAPIYAQVTGYVAHWFRDYGARVKAGDVLATIDMPSLDAQFAASKAKLAVAQARYSWPSPPPDAGLRSRGRRRWEQDVDVKAADAAEQKRGSRRRTDCRAISGDGRLQGSVRTVRRRVTARRTNVGD